MRNPALRWTILGVAGVILVATLLVGRSESGMAGYSCGGTIRYGSVVYESIPSSGWSCDYYFSGWSGDYVTIRMTSNAVDPYLRLYDPRGRLVASNNNRSYYDKDSEIRVSLSRRGTYTILASSYDGTSKGSFRLSLTGY